MDMSKILEQAQKMQEQMQATQEHIAELRVEGKAGGDMVTVTMDGLHHLHEVKFDKTFFDPDLTDPDAAAKLIKEAVNDATTKVESETRNRMSALATELKLPNAPEDKDDN